MKCMQRLLFLLPSLWLGGCVVMPYDPYPYTYRGPVVYAPVAPYYVLPSSVYLGVGGGWRR